MSEVLAILVVVVAMPLNWIVTAMLWRLYAERPTYKVLRERAIASLGLALIVSVFALVFVNNEMAMPILDAEATRLLTRTTLLVFSVGPALYWLRIYWHGAK